MHVVEKWRYYICTKKMCALRDDEYRASRCTTHVYVHRMCIYIVQTIFNIGLALPISSQKCGLIFVLGKGP